MEDWFLQTWVTFRIQNMNNSLLLPEARGPGSCFQGFCSPPFLLPQGAGCSGAQLPPWWCLHGCSLPSGPWCPYWAGENTTTSPSEPAAPWTTAKGTGEGQGQLPQEQSGACHPLGWLWGHTNLPAVPTVFLGQMCLQQLGQGWHPPRLSALTRWHKEQPKSRSSVGQAGAQPPATPTLTHLFWIQVLKLFQNASGFMQASTDVWVVMFGFRIQTPVVIFYSAIHPTHNSMAQLNWAFANAAPDKSGFSNFKIKTWKILTASLQRCTRVELTPSFFLPSSPFPETMSHSFLLCPLLISWSQASSWWQPISPYTKSSGKLGTLR